VETVDFLLSVDGGGTQCRARLASPSGKTLGEGVAGPANIHILQYAQTGDPAAVALMRRATRLISVTARLADLGTEQVALVGGVAKPLGAWLAPETRAHLVPPAGDALTGASLLAREEAAALAAEA
jgi:N-acetylglucosamine kinase-like BadF-type ATPase